MSATTDLGKVGITVNGAWSDSVAYEKNSIVNDGADSYISIQDVPIGTALSNTAYWTLLCNGFSSAEVVSAVNAWLVAHPEATTTVQDGAITLAKLASDIHDDVADIPNLREITTQSETVNTIDYGLLDDITWTDNSYMSKNGGVNSNNNYKYSSKIPVKEGDTVAIIGTTIDGALRFVTAFNGDTAVASEGKEYTYFIEVPSGIDGIVITIDKSAVPRVTNLVKTSTTINTEMHEIEPVGINGVSVIGGNALDVEPLCDWSGYYINVQNGRIISQSNATYDSYIVPIGKKKYNIINPAPTRIRFALLLEADGKTAVGSLLQYPATIDNTEGNASYLALTINSTEVISNFALIPVNEPEEKTYYVEGNYKFENLDIETNLHVYLPSEIPVGVGRTIELYNELVCLEHDKYHMRWECSVGVQFEKKYSIIGATTGSYPLTLTIYDDSLNSVWTGTSTVKVVANGIGTAKNILPIGDSLTNNKAWLPEVETLSEGKVQYVGTRGGASQTYHHEGRSGASTAWYNGNNTYTFDNNYVGNPSVEASANPFWDGSKFSLNHYITTQTGYVDTPDAIQILLGINGIALDPTTNINNLKTMVDSIVAEYPTMPIFMCNTIYRSNQNGYYSTGGQGYTSASGWAYHSDMEIMNLQNAIAETFKDYSTVFIVPCSVCMDREHDFGWNEVNVNPRLSTVKDYIPSESVHPQQAGYLQMADVMYSSYIAHLS